MNSSEHKAARPTCKSSMFGNRHTPELSGSLANCWADGYWWAKPAGGARGEGEALPALRRGFAAPARLAGAVRGGARGGGRSPSREAGEVSAVVDGRAAAVFPSRLVLRDLQRRARGYAHHALVAPRHGSRPATRHLRNLAAIANELLGRPLRPLDEAATATVGAPQAAAASSAAASRPTASRSPATRRAPVLVYFDGKDHRTLARVEDLLRGRGLAYQVLDVSADEAERSWATTTAKSPELPLVFVAGAPVGGWDALLAADVSGELLRLVAAAG